MVKRPIVGAIEISLRDGIYQWSGKYPSRLEGITAFDLLTENLPEFEGTRIIQPDEIYIWATGASKGELWKNWSHTVGVNDQEAGVRFIADPKQKVRYHIDMLRRALIKTTGEAVYRHADKMTRGYMYIGEISDIVNQFLSKGFTLKE